MHCIVRLLLPISLTFAPGSSVELAPVSGTVLGPGGPVAGATVRVRARYGSDPFEEKAAEVITDQHGRFVVPLPVGMNVELITAKKGLADEAAFIDRVHSGGVDVGAIVLRDTATLSGRIVDSGGRGIAERTILAIGSKDPWYHWRSRSNARGRFGVEHLPADTYKLAVVARGYAPRVALGIAHDPGLGPTDVGPVALSPGVALRGRVLDETGAPVEGASIQVHKVEGFPRSMVYEVDEWTTESGGDGRFRLDAFQTGAAIELYVSHESFLPREGYVQVRAATGVEVPIVLRRGGSIAVRVTDQDGHPIPGASVEANLRGITSCSASELPKTDLAGRLELAPLVDGLWHLSVSAIGYEYTTVQTRVGTSGAPAEELEVSLRRLPEVETGGPVRVQVNDPQGRPVAGASVRLSHITEAGNSSSRTSVEGGSLITDLPVGPYRLAVTHPDHPTREEIVEVGSAGPALTVMVDAPWPRGDLSGTVKDPAGKAVAGAVVELLGGPPVYGGRTTRTDPEGQFQALGVRAGTYDVRARVPGLTTARRQVEVAGGSRREISLQVAPGFSVRGQIRGLNEAARVNASIVARSGIEDRVGNVDSQGRYRIEPLSPGLWTLLLTVDGHESLSANRTIEVPALAAHAGNGDRGRELQVHLDVETREATKSVPVVGWVIDEFNRFPAETFRVEAVAKDGQWRAQTDGDGRFVFEDVPLDRRATRIRVFAGAEGPFTFSREIGSGDEIQLHLAGLWLRGHLRDGATGEAIPNASMEVRRLDPIREGLDDGLYGVYPPERIPKAVLPDGRFEVGPIDPGVWQLEASAAGYASLVRRVQVEPMVDVNDLRLELEPTPGLRVRARLASGEIPQTVRLRFVDSEGNVARGRIELHGVIEEGHGPDAPGGSYRLLAWAGLRHLERQVAVPGPPVDLLFPPMGAVQVEVPQLELERGLDSETSVEFLVESLDGGIGGDSAAGERRQFWRGSSRFGKGALGPGLYRVRVRAMDGRDWNHEVVVSDGVLVVVLFEQSGGVVVRHEERR